MASAARSLSIAHGFAVRDATRSRSVRRVLASIPCAFPIFSARRQRSTLKSTLALLNRSCAACEEKSKTPEACARGHGGLQVQQRVYSFQGVLVVFPREREFERYLRCFEDV